MRPTRRCSRSANTAARPTSTAATARLPKGKPALAKTLGNTQRFDGSKYCGRGFVQLTGRRNYTHWAQQLGIDLVNDPDLCLDAKHSTPILVEGSIKGSFTGKKLADYFDGAKEDWRNARRIINGTDKADLIAGHARQFYGAISYTK